MSANGGDGIALARTIARSSRPAGSVAERSARAECASFLRERSFEVTEQPFDYSALPGKWATPFSGVTLILASWIGAAALEAGRAAGGTIARVAAWSVGFVMLAWVYGRRGSAFARYGRRTGVNLVACRGVPSVWLVAHLDTKGQPVSLLVRAGGVIVVAVGWLVTLGGWIVYARGGADGTTVAVSGLILAGFGALPLALSVVIDRGTGALDNASGVATIFEAVDRLPPDLPVGVLVTTGEELALAGARAWAATERPGIAINCDGVDDEGEIVCIVSRDAAGRLERSIDAVRRQSDARVRVRRTLPGVLFDSVALAQAGWEAVTVARGTLRALARVHTAGDTLARWNGSGVADTASFVAAVAGAIVGWNGGDHPAEREEQQWSRT